jgi:hypothetical protein
MIEIDGCRRAIAQIDLLARIFAVPDTWHLWDEDIHGTA